MTNKSVVILNVAVSLICVCILASLYRNCDTHTSANPSVPITNKEAINQHAPSRLPIETPNVSSKSRCASHTLPSMTKTIVLTLPFTHTPVRVFPGVDTADWWRNVERKKWEPSTFYSFYQEIDNETIYVGFGEWNAVTGLMATQVAKTSILVEVDPMAFTKVLNNVCVNNHIADKAILDNRGIGPRADTIQMVGAGQSGSKINDGSAYPSDWRTFTATIIHLKDLLVEYGYSLDKDKLFIKMDTEGAEAIIIPSLTLWFSKASRLPSMLISMHNKATYEQRAAIADFLNLYPFFAVIRGRHPEPRADRVRYTASTCRKGMALNINNGRVFTADNVCSWCDYLLTQTKDNSIRNCKTTPTVLN